MVRIAQKLVMIGMCGLSVVAPASDAPRVRTVEGVVAGKRTADGKVKDFLGIPYAQPPVGALRWKAPQPVAKWAGVKEAVAFGNRCIQSGSYPDILFRDPGESEDCLTLNVWVPANAAGKKLPVMVWFYGGGFNMGGTSEARQDGENLSRKGVIVVSMNYRLGIFGFFAMSELVKESPHHAAGDYGLMDQNAAMQWVRRNIAAFGGDAGNVTIFGQSAGSSAVSVHMAMPMSRGLFAHAIAESGSGFKRAELAYPATAKAQAEDEEFAKKYFGDGSLAKLRSVSAKELLKAALTKGEPRFQPSIDGYVIPKRLAEIYEAGEQAHVPLLVGWVHDEGTNQVVNQPAKLTVKGLRETAKEDFGAHANEFLDVYTAADDAEASRAAKDYASDKFIGYSTWDFVMMQAATGKAPMYRYRFDLGSPGDPLHPAANGAFHADEIEYVFDNLDSRKNTLWRAEDRELAKLMQSYWLNFAKTGNPNGPGLPHWPVFDEKASAEVMFFDAKSGVRTEEHRKRFLFLRKQWSE